MRKSASQHNGRARWAVRIAQRLERIRKGKTMKRFLLSLVVLLLVSLAILAAAAAAEGLGVSQTNSGDGVTVKVTYLAQSEHESKFSVVLDTHSVNLDVFDFKALSLMR